MINPYTLYSCSVLASFSGYGFGPNLFINNGDEHGMKIIGHGQSDFQYVLF